MEKHKMPLRCKIHRFFFGYSPSLMLMRCQAGVKKEIKKCNGCECSLKEKPLLFEEIQRHVEFLKKGPAQ